jgi:hypothetical protein
MEKTMHSSIINEHELYTHCVTHEMEVYFFQKNKKESSEVVKIKILELLKYLSMAHHESGHSIPVSTEIDNMWHLWILQTQQYQELMDKLPSKKFIHHSSDDYQDNMLNINDSEYITHQISYLVSYLRNFGPFTEKTITYWPMAKQLLEELKSVTIVNKYLNELAIENAI